MYKILIRDGWVSPAPDFRGTKRQALAMLREIEQEETRLRNKLEVAR